MSDTSPSLTLLSSPGTPQAGDTRTTIVHVVGARPDFVKVAPVVAALARRDLFRQVIVHTGQHYDARMSDDIIADLDLPAPDRFLEIGSGTHAAQTAKALTEFERVLVDTEPDLVLVAGAVNSTLACALAASKLGIAIAHLESGLRSFDWSMPEEINRVLTDRLSDTLLTHSPEACENLLAEGIGPSNVFNVGSTMIDSLRLREKRARALAAWQALGQRQGEYVLVTLHRPANVDEPVRLLRIVDSLVALARHVPVVFPIHPRTRARLSEGAALGELERAGVVCSEPIGYLDFLSLEAGAGAIVTDSGGVQEEASALGVACYTFGPSTERTITLTHGTNVLLGDNPADIADVRPWPFAPTPCAIPLWDGRAAERVADVLIANYVLQTARPVVSAG